MHAQFKLTMCCIVPVYGCELNRGKRGDLKRKGDKTAQCDVKKRVDKSYRESLKRMEERIAKEENYVTRKK